MAGLAIGFILTFPWSSASAGTATTTPPTVTVTPNADLGGGQFVQVAWSGTKKGALVYFRQCVASPTTVATDCTALYQITAISDATGAGSTYLAVTEGDVASESGPPFRCDKDTPCSIGVFTDPGNLASAGFAPITFAATPDDCPPANGANVLGSGGGSPYRGIFSWLAKVCQPPDSLDVGYTLTGSTAGRANFVRGTQNGGTDFAVSGDPLTADEASQLADQGRTSTYAPVSTSGVVLAYKVFEPLEGGAVGNQITDLKLNPTQVAQIFTGALQNWHFGGIQELNPDLVFPANIKPFVRGDGAASTFSITSWMTAQDPTDYPDGPTESYPPGYGSFGVTAVTGALTQALAVAAPTDADFLQNGYIGYMDSSLAAYYGLPSVQIEQPGGSGSFITPTPEAIDQALTHATVNPDGITLAPDYATTDPDAYPMPMVDYAIVPTNEFDGDKGDVLRAFLDYAVHDGQSILPAGYAPLTADLVDDTETAIQQIPSTEKIPPTTPPPTTPPPIVPSSGFPSLGFGGSPLPSLSTLPPATFLRAPCPGATPVAGSTASAGASAHPVAGPSVSGSATPSATPVAGPTATASPSASSPPSPTSSCAVVSAPARTLPSADLVAGTARLILPAIFALGLVGLSAGPLLQFLSRARGSASTLLRSGGTRS